MPARIVLLRHAEKPDDAKDIGLSRRGRIRAAALSVYLPEAFGTPTHLVATQRSNESDRPALTLQPLSQAIGLPIETSYDNSQAKRLADELLVSPAYRGACVFVCWHHGTIPELAQHLGVRDPPEHWGDDVFDRIWVIDYSEDKSELTKMHQRLLYGDVE